MRDDFHLHAAAALPAIRLLEPVSAGAHGQVWRALHRPTGTPLAVKVLLDAAPDFESEAAAVARMDHPHIVPILDLGRFAEEGVEQVFLVMPWAEQGTVAEASEIAVVPLARQLLSALAHAHARGVVHLDLKPANVLLREGDAWLTDFSIARLDNAPTKRVRGTPRYMAPEQFSGAGIGPWTDRYGLGCLLYELLAGRSPFEASGPKEWARLHRYSEAPPLPTGVPEGLTEVVNRLMSKAPGERFGSDREASLALLDASAGRAAPLGGGSTTFTVDSGALFERAETPSVLATLPVPEDWRTAAQPVVASRAAVGSSVALLRLRATATVGRNSERGALWQALRTTQQTGRSQAVVLTGPPGVGLSHLASWVRIHAEELGVAVGVELGASLPFGVVGVVVLDDASRADQQRVLSALSAPDRGPRLIVMVCRGALHPALQALHVSVLDVVPFSREEHTQFLRGLLPLEPELGAEIYAHSGGLAEPTVRLAARWLRDGLLDAGGHATELPSEERGVLAVLACFEGPAPVAVWERGCALLGLTAARTLLPGLHDRVRRVRGELVLTDPELRIELSRDAKPLMRKLAASGVGTRRERGRWWVLAGEGVRGARLLMAECESKARARGALLRPMLSMAAEGLRDADSPEDELRLTYLRMSRLASAHAVEEAQAEGELARLPEAQRELLVAWNERKSTPGARLLQVAQRVLASSSPPFVEVQASYFGANGAAMAGDGETMAQLYRRGAWVAAAAGLHEWSAACLSDLAGWAGRLQETNDGVEYAWMALETATEHGFAELAGYARLNIGENHRRQGRAAEAEEQFARAERELELCGSVASATARMLRLQLLMGTGRPLRTQFSALRRLFDAFPNGGGPAAPCAVAEAICAYDELDARRGEQLAAELCDRFDREPPFADLLPSLRELQSRVHTRETQVRLRAWLG